jgi:drug/metabolite transporter (DMT)-like permease
MTLTVSMSRLPETTWRFSPGPKAVWTLVGAAAIPLWATWPLLAVLSAGSIPLFQFLAIIFAVGAAVLLLVRRPPPPRSETGVTPKSSLRASTWAAAVMIAVGLFVSDIFFIKAIQIIPAAQASLLNYLWPLMIVVAGVPLGLVQASKRHTLSMLLGLAGAALVIGPDVSAGAWSGIVLALATGLSWTAYCLFRLWQGPDAPDALVQGFALSAGAAIILHLAMETTVVPPIGALISAVLVGVIPLALGNLAWDHGVRRGDRVLLATLAYATPLVGALFLIAFGFSQATLGLLAGGVCIVAAGIISAR